MKWSHISVLFAVALGLTSCSGDKTLSLEKMMDPAQCMDCHPNHYREWSGSMHAYAADDPVFIAMNQRGQRETNGALGDFCVNCHAPMAVRLGLTTDGLNLHELPQYVKGVTCYFCHSVTEVKGTHNNPLVIANDGIMRGGLSDPVPNSAHKTEYSPLLDRSRLISGHVCGSCHDIVNQHGVHLERTFAEWKESDFGDPHAPTEETLSCAQCHMRQSDGLAAESEGVPLRKVHDHSMPGVDVALTPWPEKEAQIEGIKQELSTVILSELCVDMSADEGAEAIVTLKNIGAGHSFPSGAGQDRRVWVEVVASKDEEIIHSSGQIGDKETVSESEDPDLWRIRDFMFDDDFQPVHMFWDATGNYDGLLKGLTHDHTETESTPQETRQARSYKLAAKPDEVSLRMYIRPMGRDILQDLVDSGDLDPKYLDEIQTFEISGAALNWTEEDAAERTTILGTKALCVPKFMPGENLGPPIELDVYALGLSKEGQNGLLTATLQAADPTPPTIGENSWTVLIHDADAQPIEDATITGTSWMPDHKHGSAIIASSTHIEGGTYKIEPIELFMPGVWEITLNVEQNNEVVDAITFKFKIN